jgi:hypothetical protein
MIFVNDSFESMDPHHLAWLHVSAAENSPPLRGERRQRCCRQAAARAKRQRLRGNSGSQRAAPRPFSLHESRPSILQPRRASALLSRLTRSPRQAGATALHLASGGGHFRVAKVLLEAKAEVNCFDAVRSIMAPRALGWMGGGGGEGAWGEGGKSVRLPCLL